jgi:tetraacyldisaccharide 4'-kinase
VARVAPEVPTATVHLAPEELRGAVGTDRQALDVLAGARVLAIAAVGDPRAFVRQLEALGATVVPAVFADHYRFTDGDARELALRAAAVDLAVCTLKDAVKLAPLWPRAAVPLWYVSQRVIVERGQERLGSLLDDILQARSAARPPHRDTAGAPPAQ